MPDATELPLWMQPGPPSVPVDTSEEAANRIQPHAATLRQRVVAFIRAQGPRGATAHEITAALAMDPSTVRPRLREAEGWGGHPIEIVQTVHKRLTPSGRLARVYVAL